MPRKMWVYNPRLAKPQVSKVDQAKIKTECDQFIETQLKPKNIRPFNPKNTKDPQLVDIYCKWHRHYIHFIGVYKDLRPDVVSKRYEEKLGRLEYTAPDRFMLCYMRHNDEWGPINFPPGDSLADCLKTIEELPHFMIL